MMEYICMQMMNNQNDDISNDRRGYSRLKRCNPMAAEKKDYQRSAREKKRGLLMLFIDINEIQ